MPATMFPLEFYLGHTDEFEPDSDYVNGEIEPPPMGELDHATWQMAIQQWFDRHRTEWNIRTLCGLRVHSHHPPRGAEIRRHLPL